MSKVYSSIISIILSFVIVTIILISAGLFPYDFFASLIKALTGFDILTGTFNIRVLGSFFAFLVPILLTGLSVSFAFKTGLFNIGAEGQFMIGGLVAVFLGLTLDLPPVIFPIVILIGSALGGAIWGFVPGILKATKNVHEVVICIMMNYIALYLSNLYVKGVDGFANSKTPNLPDNALLKSNFLSKITNGSNMNLGIVIAIIAVVVYYIIINRSTLGYKLKVIGFNKDAAEYAGINVKVGMVQSMAISGAFSGIAGAILVLGTFYVGRDLPGFENYGFNGLNVALVGGGSSIGIILAAMLFTTLASSSALMQLVNIPTQITELVSGIIIFFISLSLVTDDKLEHRRLKKKHAQDEKGAK